MRTPFSIRRPRTVLLVAALVAAAAAVGIPRLTFETDLRSLVGDHSASADLFFDLQDHGAANEALFLTVAVDSVDRIDDAVTHARGIQDGLREASAVKAVESGLSEASMAAFQEYVAEHVLLMLPPENVKRILERLSTEGMSRAAAEARAMLESAAPLSTRELLLADPFALRELIDVPDAGGMPEVRDGFLVSEDGNAVLLVVTAHAPPTEGEEAAKFLAAVRGVIEDREAVRADGVSVDLAGGYLFAEAAEAQVRGDLVRTLVPSILAVVLLFWLFFRSFSGLLIVGAPVALALIVTMGAVGWTGVRITPVTAAFCALLVGLGVDFGIHLLVSIHVESRDGRSLPEAVALARSGVSRGIVMGGLTTAGSVLTLAFADLPGLASLGMMLAIGVVVAMASALTVSVAVVMLLKRGTAGHGGGPFAALGESVVARRGTIRILAILLVVGLVVTFGLFGLPVLSDDPSQLRPADDPPTQAVRRLAERFPSRLMPDLAAWRGTDLDAGIEAIHSARRIAVEGGLDAPWSGPGSLVPAAARQTEILSMLGAYPISGFAVRAAVALRDAGVNARPFMPAIVRLRTALSVDRPIRGTDLLSPVLAPVARRFVVETGDDTILVAYHAGGTEAGRRLGTALGEAGVPVVATGPRALLGDIADRVEAEFRLIPLAVLALVFVATAIGFRSLKVAILSMIPVVLGVAITLATMIWTGLQFNMVNIGLIPMVLGLGVDDGIQFMNRLRHEGARPISATFRHVGGAILLTTLTTSAAFGSLVISTNPGIASMGSLVTLGALSCCVVTLLVLPVLLFARRSRT